MRLIDADAFDEWLQKHEEAAALLEATDSDVFIDKDRKTYYSTQSFRDVMRYRPTIQYQPKKKVAHTHQEFPEHDWRRRVNGNVDLYASEYDYHHGPRCERCGYSFCMVCSPDGWNSVKCAIDYDSCPTCNKKLIRHENYCSDCGQALDWSE